MAAKKHEPEEIIGKLHEVEIILGQGGTTAEAYRDLTQLARRCPALGKAKS